MSQAVRAIDWATDCRRRCCGKIRAGEGHPGVLDKIDGKRVHLFRRSSRRGVARRPGEIIATRNGAVCRATVDGAVWITHLERASTRARGSGCSSCRPPMPWQRPASRPACRRSPPEVHTSGPAGETYREIAYEERDGVGYLGFDFYNGAMSTEQCQRLLDAYRHAALASRRG